MLTDKETDTLRETLKTGFPDLDNDSKALIMGIAERNNTEGFKLLTALLYMLQKHPLQTSDQQETSA